MTTKRPLDKAPDPISIDIRTIILASIIFALVFFLIGSAFRHYVSIGGVI